MENTQEKPEPASELPEMTNEFVIDVVGTITKKRFLGDFTSKIMNQKEQALIVKKRAFLNGPDAQGLDDITLYLHYRIAYLRYALVLDSVPKFWTDSDYGYELYDSNVIEEIFVKVLAWEKTWMEKVWGVDVGKEAK